jgi:hypothetical protein
MIEVEKDKKKKGRRVDKDQFSLSPLLPSQSVVRG